MSTAYKLIDSNHKMIDIFYTKESLNIGINHLVEKDVKYSVEEYLVDDIFLNWDPDLDGNGRLVEYNDEPRCPECGYLDHDYYQESDNEIFEEKCPLCEKTFEVYTEIQVKYSTVRKD